MKQVTIPAQWLQELIALCGPEDHELRERVMKSAAQAPADARDANVQWWLADIDQYGNPALTDGAHSDRAGADKAAYLINAMGLGQGRKFAVARVELSDPKPSAEDVNHEAIAQNNRAAIAAAKGQK